MEQCRAKQGVAATSRRHHVPTSSQQCRSQQFSNIATSQRRDVSTSRRQLENLHLIISCTNGSEIRVSGSVRREARISRARVIQTSRECPRFVPLFIFLDSFGYYDDVFDTRHFVLFFHDVLDLFLGLHQTLSQTMD